MKGTTGFFLGLLTAAAMSGTIMVSAKDAVAQVPANIRFSQTYVNTEHAVIMVVHDREKNITCYMKIRTDTSPSCVKN